MRARETPRRNGLTPRTTPGLLSGAAFLMAVSAIGPGFLTQTTQFTARLGASLAFAILISIIIDIGAQLNTWRVICISGLRGHELADKLVPGLGYVVTGVIVFGSFVFNLGNLSGCALALESLFHIQQWAGLLLSSCLAILLFILPGVLRRLDWFSKLLGGGMILMTLYILVTSHPPYWEAARESIIPKRIDSSIIVTLIGGTIGGYVMFSGAHRLLDGGISGIDHQRTITWASIRGILITGVMRTILFLAVLGVVAAGTSLSEKAPVFDAFKAGAGGLGYVISGVVFWSAAITSVVGCSYTSISFLGRRKDERTQSRQIVAFIILTLVVALIVKQWGLQPTPLLIAAGTLNGVFLPIILGVVLVASYRRDIMSEYRHPWWAISSGLLAWIITLFMAYRTIMAIL